MKYHKFLQDEVELDKFLEIVRNTYTLVKDEVILIELFVRNKYLSPEEKAQVDLSRSNVVTRQTLISLETKDVTQALRKMECAVGAYLDRSGNPIPNECLIPYFVFNPCSPIKAFADTQRCFTEYLMELDNREGNKSNTYHRLAKIQSQYQSQLQHAFSRKVFIDVDFDIPDREYGVELTNIFMESLRINGVYCFRVMTRSGFHVLIEKASIKYNWNNDLESVVFTALTHYDKTGIKWEIEQNPNGSLPLAGCTQKDHLVKVF
jgi:hypothetical protein